MPDVNQPPTPAATADSPGRAATLASIVIVLAVALLLIWTALEPMPRFPYLQIAGEEPPLPRICSIVAANDQQRQRQLERCPPEALADLDTRPNQDD